MNDTKKPDCYVVLKDSDGITHHIYGILVRDGRKTRVVEFLGAPHIFPAADVVVFGNLNLDV